MNDLGRFVLLFIVFSMYGCDSGPVLAEHEYIAWIQNPTNSATQISSTRTQEISCFYKPSDYIILEEIGNGIINEDKVEERLLELEEMMQFRLSFMNIDGTRLINKKEHSKDEIKERERYFRYKVEENIKMVLNSGEEIKPSITHFVRNYGIKPTIDIIIAFRKKNNSSEFRIEYRNELQDTTDVRFEFDLEKIAQLQKI